MTVPDYIISHTVAEEHQHYQARQQENPDLPEPKQRAPRQGGMLATIRHNLSDALHTLARRIEPEAPAYR